MKTLKRTGLKTEPHKTPLSGNQAIPQATASPCPTQPRFGHHGSSLGTQCHAVMMSRGTSLPTAVCTGSLATERQSLPDLRLVAADPRSDLYRALPLSHLSGGGWILLQQRSLSFRGAAAGLNQWKLIHLQTTSSPWRWIYLCRKSQWRWIHLHRARANPITSCLPGDVVTSVGGSPGALDFHLGVEVSPSAREPLRRLLLPTPPFPIPHLSPGPLPSSFPSSEEKGRTWTGVHRAVLRQEESFSRKPQVPCSLQVSPNREGVH